MVVWVAIYHGCITSDIKLIYRTSLKPAKIYS